MASLCAARAPVATRPSTRHQPVRSVAVRAAASPQKDQKPVATSKVAQWTAAGLAAAYLAAMPAFAAESPPSGLKQKICANNPTAKICLRGSYQRTFDSK